MFHCIMFDVGASALVGVLKYSSQRNRPTIEARVKSRDRWSGSAGYLGWRRATAGVASLDECRPIRAKDV